MLKRLLIALGLIAAPSLTLPESAESYEVEEQVSSCDTRKLARQGILTERECVIDVDATWDEDARLWLVTRPTGLSLEAETFSVLVAKLQLAVPRLKENAQWPEGVLRVTYVVNKQVEIRASRPA
jgi:hypothetical protein